MVLEGSWRALQEPLHLIEMGTNNIFLRGVPKTDTLNYAFISIALWLYFLLLQGYEYSTVSFQINDSAFGSIFYLLTGLHGLHVIIGVLFLMFAIAVPCLIWIV